MSKQGYGASKGWFVTERGHQLEALTILAGYQMKIDEVISTSPYEVKVGEDKNLADFDSTMHALLEFLVYLHRVLTPTAPASVSMSEKDLLEGMDAMRMQLMKVLWEKEFMDNFTAWAKDPTLAARWKNL